MATPERSTAEKNLDDLEKKLKDHALDVKTKCGILIELRDGIEQYCQSTSYGEFLQRFVPILLELLKEPPVFVSSSPEHRLRNTILEILHRLPSNATESTEKFASDIVDRCIALTRIENEDNAILCIKITNDLERYHPKLLADRVPPFVELLLDILDGMHQIVKDTFDDPTPSSAQSSVAAPNLPSTPAMHNSPHPGSPVASAAASFMADPTADVHRALPKGVQSFKLVAECPIILVSILQAHKQLAPQLLKSIIPRVKAVLNQQAKPQRKAHDDAKARGAHHRVVTKEIAMNPQKRAAFGDLLVIQIKTVSFLAYLLRVHSGSVDEFVAILPDIVVRLLQDCPKEKPAARKELLITIRHIVNFRYRNIFLPRLDNLLDEQTLLGDALTVHEQSRSLAYTTLADLIHHMRDSLTRDQIHKTIEVYSRNLRDESSASSFGTMSAKLLSNLAEPMANLKDKRDARYLIMMVLSATGDQLAVLNRCYKNNIKRSSILGDSGNPVELVPENHMADKDNPPDWDDIDIFHAGPIKPAANPYSSDKVVESKFTFKNLVAGLKTIFYQLRATNPQAVNDEMDPASVPTNWSEVAYGFNPEEVNVLVRLFHEGAQVFRYYTPDKAPEEAQTGATPVEHLANQHMMTSGKEEKDLLEAFAGIFHHIDPSTFYEIFQTEIPHLYNMIYDHAALLHVPQFLLASEATSPAFCGLLLQFLMGKLEEVGTADVQKSSVLLRLFKLSFMAVTLFSDKNEAVLLPHVTTLITKSIELSVTAEEPMNYFLLLRSLFRSIGGGRFERLYKEILPLLEMLLEVLNNLLISARKPHERDLFVELSLTVPARLSHLLPHLAYLMRPLVVALKAGSELIAQGLRTLELCVDNLTADYLDPIMAPVIDDLMAALWDHLKPQPYSHYHSHTTLRILGKLGGRNRKFLTSPPNLQYRAFADDDASLNIRLTGSSRDRSFPVHIGCDTAIEKLKESPKLAMAKRHDGFHKHQALNLIKAQTKLLIGIDHLPADAAQLTRLQASDLFDKAFDNGADPPTASEKHKSTAKLSAQRELLLKLLKALMFAASVPEVSADATEFLTGVYRHFTLLEVGRALMHEKRKARHFSIPAGPGLMVIESTVIADAIAETLSSDDALVRDQGRNAINAMWTFASTIFGAADKAESLPLFLVLFKRFMHCCYEEDWFIKSGGVEGIAVMLNDVEVSNDWLRSRQLELVAALLFVIKDMPQDLPATVRIKASDLLQLVVRRCNKDLNPADLQSSSTSLHQVITKLITDLAHLNKHVRKATQEALRSIAEMIGLELSAMVKGVNEMVIMTLFNKPLRALPIAAAIGHMDALAFFLEMKDGILENDDKLKKALLETLALVEADDDALLPKPYVFRSAESIVNLRVACLNLLTIATSLPGYQDPKFRMRTVAVFFKLLYAKNEDVSRASNAGLKIVLGGPQKLPKDILQAGLRPILANVQDIRKLSVDGLEGLRTLLQLLTNYFKVEIGTRLLDHMNTIAAPPNLQRISFSLIDQDLTIRKCTAILSVFHLLPAQAVAFVSQLAERVLSLEKGLRRSMCSPFRTPLIRYFNKYAEEAWKYFASKLKDETLGRFFAQLLQDESAGPLRIELIRGESFTTALSSAIEVDPVTASVNAIQIAHAISQHVHTRGWLVENHAARSALLNAAKLVEEKRRANAIPLQLRTAVESMPHQVMDIFTVYMTCKPDDLDFLFELMHACVEEDLRISSVLFSFLYTSVICNPDLTYQRRVATKCIDLFTTKAIAAKHKEFILHYVLTPMLAHDVQRNWKTLFVDEQKGTELMDKSLADTINAKLWQPQITSSDVYDDPEVSRSDFYRMELMQLTAFLLKYHKRLIEDLKKDVIKFGWLCLRLDDAINKYGSYCIISYFIAQYETPVKIVAQVYGKLLQAHQTEGRHVVIQALEIIEPVLVERMKDMPSKMPSWARVPRKILSEEVSNSQQLACIYQFVAKHPDLFYSTRESFAAIIIPTINKICSLPSPSPDQKTLALSLFATVWSWEKRSRDEAASASGMQVDGMNAERQGHQFIASPNHRLLLIKFIVQFIATLQETFPITTALTTEEEQPQAKTVTRALELLYRLLCCWDDLEIDHMFPKVTEQILLSEPKASSDNRPDVFWSIRVNNTLQIIRVFLNARGDQWVVDRLPQLQKLLVKHIKNDKLNIQATMFDTTGGEKGFPELKGIIQRCLDAIPVAKVEEDMPDADETSPSEAFMAFLSGLAGDQMSAGKYVSSINITWAMTQRKPEDADTHIPALLKALQTKLAKDHLATQMPPPDAGPGTPIALPSPDDVDMTVILIIKVMEIMSARMSVLGEQRRPYLSVLASVVERSSNKKLCKCILLMVDEWIFNSTEAVPTLKEKTAVLVKMLVFEFRPDQTLYHDFLDLIIRIYENPSVLRSELAVRMEHAFLVGLRTQDITMRTRFMTIIDRSLSRTLTSRFYKLIVEQQWDILADSYWLSQIIHLLFGSIDMNNPARLGSDDFRTMPISDCLRGYATSERVDEVMLDDSFESLMLQQKRFMQDLQDVKVKDLLEPMVHLQHTDNKLAHEIWLYLFPMCWSALSKEDRDEIETGLIRLLTKDFHNRQADRRPNCVATMLEGIARSTPTMKFPPHVMKFQAKAFDGWYTAASYIEGLALRPVVDTASVRESTLDALTDLYQTLQETDLFYGVWRRRCQFVETNAALSHEQVGAWEKAQHMYEQAQIKARTGSLSFSPGEYMLWEDHWVYCAEKLQQWEILGDFAKHESLNDLFLEATWRQYDNWQGAENQQQLDSIIKAVSDAPTPRRLFFGAFMSLLKLHASHATKEDQKSFEITCDENIQLSIRQWHKLPKDITQAHIGLLQNFQSIVELYDASVMVNKLSQTNASNLPDMSSDLKLMLGTWRDRLPNFWDDINAWQDLVTWRQHIFHIINGVYLNLLPANQSNSSNMSYAYRGYHETAWIINRFAHVARKHQMPEVCINQLSRIYTLPNIEIQEAFLKLREQAKCHYQNRSELSSGLEVINNTNLNYFGQQQKAEFYTLKGMFLAKLNDKDEASHAFGNALFFDIKLPKAWAEWGRFHDMLFKEDPSDLGKAVSAIKCYLEAAGHYKSAKCRKILSRMLWLLSLDDANGTVAKEWASHKGDTPVWYWITFIPQLLANLSRTSYEANIARELLSKLAKTYPQALYFQLRTSREDMMTIKKTEIAKAAREEKARLAREAAQAKEKVVEKDNDVDMDRIEQTEPVASNERAEQAGQTEQTEQAVQTEQADQTEQVEQKSEDEKLEDSNKPAELGTDKTEVTEETATPQPQLSEAKTDKPNDDGPNKTSTPAANGTPNAKADTGKVDKADASTDAPGTGPKTDAMDTTTDDSKPKKPWDHTDELITALRTAFPLLFFSMETMVDQVQKFAKSGHDEDAFRLTVALLNDALSYCGRYAQNSMQSVNMPAATEANLTRFAETLSPPSLRAAFEADFVNKKPTMLEYITKLRWWRDRFENMLDSRPQTLQIETATRLPEFRFMKFDDVEVPGQYLQHRDKNQDFVRIERFISNVDLVRTPTVCFRRLRIRGHDGSMHAFAIQHPAARNSRREERVMQLFRSFNSELARKKESRRRNLQFHLPVMIMLSPGVRMIADDASYISMQGIFEDHMRRTGGNKDEPIMFAIERARGIPPNKPEFQAMKLETFTTIQEKMVAPTVASDYFNAIYPTFDALWLFRKQFSSQLAALTFITFTMHMTARYPSKMNISRSTGNIWGQELVPQMAQQRPILSQMLDPVPFRLTPNLQMIMGPIHTEGIFVCCLQAIARCLTDITSNIPSSAAPTPNPNTGTNGATAPASAAANSTTTKTSAAATTGPTPPAPTVPGPTPPGPQAPATGGTPAPTPALNGSSSTSETAHLVDLEGQLSLFIRDEVSFWYNQQHRQNVKDGELRNNVQANTEAIVNKAIAIADGPRAGNLPASQSVLDLVARATEPRNLAMTDPLWMPWL